MQFWLLVGISVLLAAVASGRASWVLGAEWKLSTRKNNDPSARDVMTVCSVVVAMVLAGIGTYAVADTYGLFWGIIADVLTIPAIGLVWLLGVGGNKIVERIINGVDVTLSRN
jgi:hypothetical protein